MCILPRSLTTRSFQFFPPPNQVYLCIIHLIQNFVILGESADAANLFSLFALDVIMRAAFGMETNLQTNPDPEFVDKARKVFQTPLWIRFFSMIPFWEYFSKYVSPLQNADFFVGLARTILEQRQQQGHSGNRDLVQLMLEAHEEIVHGASKLSDDEITAQSVTFLIAGFETTGNTLCSTAYYLATYPEVQDRIIQEVDEALDSSGNTSLYDVVQKLPYLDQVISEVLRLCGPAFSLVRGCEEETVIKGVRFPKGIDVTIPPYVLHRDPEVWENPLEFNPENFSPEAKEKREPYAYLPFGTGPRQCIGMRFALLEIKLGLLEILRRFKFERAPETVATLEHRAVILMAPKDIVYVKIKAR